jgi:hypothetical protein
MFNSMNEFSNDIENQDSFILFGQDMKVFFFFKFWIFKKIIINKFLMMCSQVLS